MHVLSDARYKSGQCRVSGRVFFSQHSLVACLVALQGFSASAYNAMRIMPNICNSFDSAYHSPTRKKRTSTSSSIYANLLRLDSVFYQPTRWKSWYVKKLTCDLSIARHRASKPSHNSPYCQSEPISLERHSPPSSIMIQAMHQFSTIKTVYSDDRKSFVSQVNPLRAMLVQVDFEVFGDVSGVYFTKYARDMCEQLDIKGWIRVSPRGSIYGQIQGEKEKVDEMALWLRLQGSPKSKIDYCQFKNWQIIDSCDFRNFTIRY